MYTLHVSGEGARLKKQTSHCKARIPSSAMHTAKHLHIQTDINLSKQGVFQQAAPPHPVTPSSPDAWEYKQFPQIILIQGHSFKIPAYKDVFPKMGYVL